jgi:hypothetical protein
MVKRPNQEGGRVMTWIPVNPCNKCDDGTVNDLDCRELCSTFSDYCHDIQLLKKLLEYLKSKTILGTGWIGTNEFISMLKELEEK